MDPERVGERVIEVPRELSVEERKRLEEDRTLVSTFQREKLEREAKKNWDLFYKRNKDHFFKDRHWTQREFKELLTDESLAGHQSLLEIGCGVGNFIFPLIEAKSHFFIYACDFSPVAIDLVRKHPTYDEKLCKAFVADITDPDFDSVWSEVSSTQVKIITLIFVLSAISPSKMNQAIKNVFKVD